MTIQFTSLSHTFSVDDLTGTFGGLGFADDPSILDTSGSVVTPFVDKDGDVLFAIDSEFGFYVTDFIGAEQKSLDGDYAEGFAGDIVDTDGDVVGLAVRNAPTDIFRSGAPLGTWSLGLGGMTVKASTEHYASMADVLSDQAFPGDPDALRPLDDDLKLLDLRPNAGGTFDQGALNGLYIHELAEALQRAMDNTSVDIVYSDLDFDRDGTPDTFSTKATTVEADTDGDGIVESIVVGGVDLGNDGTTDLVDSFLNGFGGEADIVDLIEPNESSVTYDIAYGRDYSVTLKDDGKLLYRWGEAVKRPNDIRLDIDLELPEEWTQDLDGNGVADSLENGSNGFEVTKAELVITHSITNNPNDQVRPEDYENEAATGRKPSYYIIEDPDDPANTLWVSPVDTYNGEGDFLPSYLKLDATGAVDLGAGGIPVFDPEGNLVGYRNEDASGSPIGTVLRDLSLIEAAASANLDFETADLAGGYTTEWYTSTNREPFEWSYDRFSDDPYRNVFESFRDPDLAAAAGYTEDDLVSGPRWRLTPNKFGQDLPGLEVPLEPESKPPFQNDNIKYETGEFTTTTLNLLDWDGISPFANSTGWMAVDPYRLDENRDGLIDEGWSKVNGNLGEGDAVPEGLILSAVTPNGVQLSPDHFDTSIYVKGDRQDAAKLYDMQLVIEYEGGASSEPIGSVQQVVRLTHAPKSVTFEQGSQFDNPVVFASVTTLNGRQPVTVELSEVTSGGATLYLEEPEYLDNIHKGEDITLIALEEGIWNLSDGSLLQVGTTIFERGATDNFQFVEFGVAFDEVPALLLQVQTNNGRQWEIARAKDITTTGFQFAIQEEEGQADGIHTEEVIGWAAIDASATNGLVDWDGLTMQTFQTQETVTDTRSSFDFAAELGADPLVAGMLTSYNESDTALLRFAGISDDGTSTTAQFFAQEEESADKEIAHIGESMNGWAFSQSGLLNGVAPEADAFEFV